MDNQMFLFPAVGILSNEESEYCENFTVFQ